MRTQASSAPKLAAPLTAGMLASAACAAGGGSPPSGRVARPFVDADPDGRRGREDDPEREPFPTPIAVLEGEPWIVYAWPQAANEVAVLVRGDREVARVPTVDVVSWSSSMHSKGKKPDAKRKAATW